MATDTTNNTNGSTDDKKAEESWYKKPSVKMVGLVLAGMAGGFALTRLGKK